MSEDITKRIQVTFGTGLPLGEHAHFKHEGQTWIAYPAHKNRRILAVIDRMIGVFTTFTRQLIDHINRTPAEAPQIVTMLDTLARAQRLRDELIDEKQRGQTS